ncbi:struthiocalcin-2 isoform X3 [Struthio camelus]
MHAVGAPQPPGGCTCGQAQHPPDQAGCPPRPAALGWVSHAPAGAAAALFPGTWTMGSRTCWGLCLLGALLLAPSLDGERLPDIASPNGCAVPGSDGDGAALPLPAGLTASHAAHAGRERAGCAKGWIPFDGRCYGFFPQELSWRRAEGFCQRLGARTHLASIHSEEEHQAIVSMLASSQPYSDSEEEAGEEVWIGLHRPLGRRNWEWSDGTKLDYGSWYRDVFLRRRACVALEDTTDFATWDVELCSDRKPFICEYRT